MTEALAALLAQRVKTALPFLDRAVGVARLHEQLKNDGDRTFLERLPVPAHFTADECDRNGRYLVPDQHTGSILFFEDAGEITVAATAEREATLRLLLWLNPFKLTGAISENRLQLELERALLVRRRFDAGDYRGVYITSTTLPAGAALFGAYSFGGGTTPLLYPPYRLLGLELKCRYHYAPGCLLGPLPELDLDRRGCVLPPVL